MRGERETRDGEGKRETRDGEFGFAVRERLRETRDEEEKKMIQIIIFN